MLLTKAKNALELFWDSLDPQERMIVAYLAASAVVSVWTVLGEAAWQRRKLGLLEELGELQRTAAGRAE